MIACHITSPENNIEWELYRDAFEIIVRNIEEPKYDLFATSRDTRCK